MISRIQLRLLVIGLIVVVMATAFTIDYFISFSFATGLLYAMAVVVTYFLHDRRALIITVSACVTLVVVGYLLSLEVEGPTQSLVNRGMEILSICMAFWLSTRIESADQELLKAHEELETRIEERTRELKQAQIASEEANQAKSRFMAVMNHELRTPLNGVIGMIELLKQSQMSDEQQEMLNTISDSGESLLMIINDILDFSKIESGKLNLESIPVSLLEIVEGAIQALAESATAKGLRLISYVDTELPQYVMGDPVRLRQIIINFASNAIKFSEKGTIVTQLVMLPRDTDGQIVVRLSVKDEGIGVSEEAQTKLFEAFTQAEDSTTRKFGGTGLGLVICRMLAETMGGKIGINSEPGEGSVFYVELPFHVSDQQDEAAYEYDLAGRRALIISSNQHELAALRKYLQADGMTVEVEENCQATLDRCAKAEEQGAPYDVVIFCPQWGRQEMLPIAKAAQAAELKPNFIFILEKTRRQKRVRKEKLGTFIEANSLKRADLRSAIADAVGLKDLEAEQENVIVDKNSATATLSVEEAKKQGTLILVAEDNEINRDILGRQLTLLGYTYEMVEDGDLALVAWRRTNYALLLTDCKMPNLGGIELTRIIRQEEEGSGRHGRIIAVTANAMEGEAERCLASGMDDFLPKPIKMDDLRRTLEKWMPPAKDETGTVKKELAKERRSQPARESAASKTPSELPIDDTFLKSNFGDDQEIFKMILVKFVQPADNIHEEIKSAASSGSAEAVEKAAHKLKGAAYSIGANELGGLCKELEYAGKNNDWNVIEKRMGALAESMTQVKTYIASL